MKYAAYNYNKLTDEAKEVISEELWSETIGRVMDALNKYSDHGKNGIDLDFDTWNVSLNLVEWANNKASRIKLFLNHPNYDASEPFKIVHEVDAVRELDNNEIRRFMNTFDSSFLSSTPWIWTLIGIFNSTFINDKQINDYNSEIKDRRRAVAQSIKNFENINYYNGAGRADHDIMYAWYPCNELATSMDKVSREKGVLITEELLDKLERTCKPHSGQKTSKFVRKLITTICGKVDERAFAKYADALNPTVFKRKAIMSVDPVDFLMMSHGNSWASCYWINENDPGSYEGCYSNGTWSYMADGTTMLMYIVDKEKTGNYATLPKIFRQCVFFNGIDTLINSRIYPSNRTDVRAEFRGYAQQFVSELWNIPNNWKVKETNINGEVESFGNAFVRDLIEESEDFVGYNDPTFYELSVSVNKANEQTQPTKIRYGGKAYCPVCGEKWYGGTDGRYICENCEGGVVCCAECGARLTEDEAYWIDGEPYCCNCTFYCDYHGERELRGYCDDNIYTVHVMTRYGEREEEWCQNAVCDNATECEDCGDYWSNDDMTYIDSEDRYVCPNCAEDYDRCEDCDEMFSKEDLKEWTDPNTGEVKMLCEDCYEEAVREAEENEEDESEAI